MIEKADSFAQSKSSSYYRDNTPDIIDKYMSPRWGDIAKDNSNRLLNELKQIARTEIETARTPEERTKAIEDLRAINPQSLGQLKTTEKRRGTFAFRRLFA